MEFLKSLIVIVLFCAIPYTNPIDENCPEAAKTVEYVERCPTSETGVKEAAKKKNCDILALTQNCTEPSKFKYHCVVNTFLDATISVCAPRRVIKGVCTEYNLLGERIQDLYSVKCTNHSPPCPSIYLSTDAYKYDSCYKLVYDKREKSSSSSGLTVYESTNANLATLPNPVNSETSISGLVIGVIVVLVVIIGILATLVIYMYFRIHQRPTRKRYIKEETEEMIRMLQDNGHTETEIEKQEHETTCLFEKDEDKPPIASTYQSSYLEKKSSKIEQIATESHTDRNVFVSRMDTIERNAEENLERTRKYLCEYKTFDKYFVETRMFQKIMHLLYKNGVAIISAPPGCGKTNAAIHLLLDKTYTEWDKRKIHNSEELSLIRRNKNTLVFIDNLFQDTSFVYGIDKWWEELEKIFETSIRMFRGKNGIHDGGRVRLLITARENVIENACKYMKSIMPVFNENSIVRVINDWCEDKEEEKDDKSNIFPLQKKEREQILIRQFDFAEKELQLENPGIEKSLLQGIIESKGPLGFPLCAHLFTCNLDYRAKGTTFFTDPTDYIRLEIETEIRDDKSNRTKTLLFTMFVHEWHFKNKDANEKLNLESERLCKQFLKGVSEDLLSKFSPFEFTDLIIVAKKLCGAFLIESEDGIFRFTHESVFEAVASYFCEKYFEQATDTFPLQILENQESSLGNEDGRQMLALRLLYEIFKGNISSVFCYKLFSVHSFVDCFFVQLRKRDDRVIEKFFASKDNSSDLALPPSFWAGKLNLYYLTDKMLQLVEEKRINPEYHFYMTLFGECCSVDEELIKAKHEKCIYTVEEIKCKVSNFKNENMDSILHLIINTSRNDDDVSRIIRHLLGSASVNMVNINERNKQNMTPIMSALECQNPRNKVIRDLVQKGAEVRYKDIKGSTVFHYCLRSNISDLTCSENLDVLIRCEQLKKQTINFADLEGETALNIAAKNNRYSRLLSILTLFDKCPAINTNTLNLDGFSPIYSAVSYLKGNDVMVNLERCARVVIFIRYGVDPDQEADTDEVQVTSAVDEVKGLTAKDVCVNMKYTHTEAILNNHTNQSKMAEILEEIMRNIQKVEYADKIRVLNPSGKMTDELMCAIERAVRVLVSAKLPE